MKSRINIDFDDTTLIPQLIGVNNCNLREIEGYINVEVDSNGSIINLYGKRKDCLVAKEIIEKSYIKLKNYKANNIEFLADSNLEFADMTGLKIDLSVIGLGVRLSRFALLIDNCILKKIFDEEGGGLEKSKAENILPNL